MRIIDPLRKIRALDIASQDTFQLLWVFLFHNTHDLNAVLFRNLKDLLCGPLRFFNSNEVGHNNSAIDLLCFDQQFP